MNPNSVTYTYPTPNDHNFNHSYSRSFSQDRGTPKASASNISYSPQTNLATMAGTPSHHAYTPSLATGMNVGVPGAAGGPGSTLQRSGTRNSYLSYADTPSWVNPSTMIETSTPATRTSRPLPDPQQYSAPRYMGAQLGHHGDYGGYTGRGSGYGHQQGRPTSGGFFITNVTEEEEEELEGGEGDEEGGYVDIHPPTRPHPHQQHNIRLPNNYNNVPNNGYSMPIGMKDGKGVPMERVAPPGQYHRRPLPVPGASQPLGRIDSLKWKKKKETSSSLSPSLAISLFAGLKRLPKKVLRYGRKKPPMVDEGDEEFGNLRNFEDMLPGYASHPATPTGLGGNIKQSPITAETENRMPGEMPTSPPQQRFRNPSLKLTRPSGETLRQGLNAEDQEFFDHSEVHNDHSSQPPPPAVEYPAPSTERERTTMMMYHENEDGSSAPPAGRSESALSRRGSSVRVGTPIPMPAIDTSVSPPADQSPETAHPQPANDYMKMAASPRTAGTHNTEYTSFSTDPSFSSDLNPVFRFFAGFYHLPWFSERSTVDYSPLTGFGQKSGGRGGIGKKAGQSWYRKKGDTAGLSSSLSLDLLSSGEGERDGEDRGSVISPLGGWRRRGGRRNAVDRVGGGGGGRHGHYIKRHDTRPGHGRGHGHGHGHGHGQRHGGVSDSRRVRGRRYRRRSTSTITFEEYHHQRNISPMIPSTYPYPFVSPPFPYFAYPPPAGPTKDTNISPNQGAPPRTGGGEEETSRDESSQQQGQAGPRGPRNNASHAPQGRTGAPVFVPGYAPSPVYPAPVWYGDAVDQRRLVYMPMSVPLPL